MNKSLAKEPSMDEILSSIRQIISDDDEVDGSDKSATSAKESEKSTSDDTSSMDTETAEEDAPLALSQEQMVSKPAAKKKAKEEEDLPDIDFSPASAGTEVVEKKLAPPEAEIAPPEPEVADDVDADAVSGAEEEIELIVADDIAFEEDLNEEAAELETAGTGMPDPELSADLAEKLLEPATDAAVRHTFSKLNALGIGGADLTLEDIVRDMLRPMLKEWLDENLPAMVERIVENEIERVSRGK